MAWRLAKSLITLRSQVNAMAPNRGKGSDGTIGNAEHQSRDSDHNPWVRSGSTGVVTALDLTHDPARGFDSWKFADMLLSRKDPRIKYVISNRRIASGSAGPSPWMWRAYGGKNPHSHHVHVSVVSNSGVYDDGSDWYISGDWNVGKETPKAGRSSNPILRRGSKGGAVERLQRALLGGLPVDGQFGPRTEAAVKAFQQSKGLVVDGKVGAYTWRALGF